MWKLDWLVQNEVDRSEFEPGILVHSFEPMGIG